MEATQQKSFYNIVQNKGSNEATINIYGVIGGFDYETFSYINTADTFLADFKEVEASADLIHIKINSPGGNVHDGLPIYNALKNSEKTIFTYVDGIAYSMAALIALSGDKVFGYSNSLFMVHNASSIAFGNASEMREEADILDKYDNALGTIIEERLDIDSNQVSIKYLNYKDIFMTAKEAKEEGFFDEIISTKKSNAPKDVKNMSPMALFKFYGDMNQSNSKQNFNSNKTKMSKERTNVQSVLGLDGPMASNDNGTYLNDEQLDQIESRLADQESTIAENNTAITNAETARDSANQTITDQNATINAVAEAAGVEVGADATATLSAIQSRIEELGKLDSAHPSKVKIDSHDAGKGAATGYNPEAAHNKIANQLN